jgi:hypothetical protein
MKNTLRKLLKIISLLLLSLITIYSCNKKDAPKGVSNKIIITTLTPSNIYADSVVAGGNISEDGGDIIKERGFCYSINQNPTLNDIKITSGSGKGPFSSKLVNLQPNTTYYIKSYCIAEQGEILGNQITFKTLAGRPIISTNQITNIQIQSANGGASISTDGGAAIIEKGLCISSINNTPAITDTFISAGQGNASFSLAIPNLQANRVYYVRAYAKNSQGESYALNTVQFKTLPAQPPIVSIASVTNITRQSARLAASIISNQGSTVTQFGLCVSASPIPTISNGTTINFFGSPITSFYNDFTNLNPNTTYYARGFAYNGAGGPSYSDLITAFTTLALQPPVVSTVLTGSITLSSASVSGNLSQDGGSIVTERGFVYSLNSTLDIGSPKVIVPGNSIGFYAASLTDLVSNSLYYVTAYAKNSIGTTISSNVLTFRTLTPNPPTITTSPISNLTSSSFQSGGTISSDGGAPIIQKGICWNTIGNPTISDTKTLNGTGSSSFSVSSSTLTQLTPNVTYFIRAYATNNGGITAYGSQISALTRLAPVQLSSPLNNVLLGCCNQIFSWTPSVDATSYEIEFSMNNTFSSLSYNLPLCSSGSLISNRVNRISSPNSSVCIGMGTNSNNGTWFWRVRPLNINNSGDWSEVRSFNYKW